MGNQAKKPRRISLSRHLALEYRGLTKPTGRKLVASTSRILVFALVAAVILHFADMGFGAILGLVLDMMM